MLRQVKRVLRDITGEIKLNPTVSVHLVPRVLHEPAILTGYRKPNQQWKYYVYSVFQLHNETVNIWTHIIGICVVLHVLIGYFQEFGTDNILPTMLICTITCIVMLILSASGHALHSKSPYVHYVALMADYIGVAVYSFGIGLAAFYGSSDPSFYRRWEHVYIPVLSTISYLNFVNLCLGKLWFGDDPLNINRKYIFISAMVIQGVINVAPFAPRYINCFNDVKCEMTSLNHVTVVNAMVGLEGLTFATHQPEKTWPGRFDIIGQGHQIFHVLLVVKHTLLLKAIYIDHKEGLSGHCSLDIVYVLSFLICIIFVAVITLTYLSKFVPYSLSRSKKS